MAANFRDNFVIASICSLKFYPAVFGYIASFARQNIAKFRCQIHGKACYVLDTDEVIYDIEVL